MGHWRQPMLLFILPKKPQEMNDFSSFLAVFFYGLMSQSLFSLLTVCMPGLLLVFLLAVALLLPLRCLLPLLYRSTSICI